MGDGAVVLMTDSVEAGDPELPTVCAQRQREITDNFYSWNCE